MLTPQEAAGHAFPRAMMGGYNMSSVDEFLDELIDDYTTLYKENTTMKAKMKVLVDKVEEYRATEDSMRATLLTAQKMADTIVKEAEDRRAAMLAQADRDVGARLEVLQAQLADVEKRTQVGKSSLAAFRQEMQSALRQQMALLERLPVMSLENVAQPSEAAPAAEQPEEQPYTAPEQGFATHPAPPPIEKTVTVQQPASAIHSAAMQPPDAPVWTPTVNLSPRVSVSDDTLDAAALVDEPTRRIDLEKVIYSSGPVLDELQFGRNYNGSAGGK